MDTDDTDDGRSPGDARDPTSGLSEAGLRERIMADIATFERSFDAAVAGPTSQTLDELRQATDRLMRSAARVMIEVERLAAARGDRS